MVRNIIRLVVSAIHPGFCEQTDVWKSIRRSGVGRMWFRGGHDWYAYNEVPSICVAPPGISIAAQHMIQLHGFLTKSCQLYIHKWFNQ